MALPFRLWSELVGAEWITTYPTWETNKQLFAKFIRQTVPQRDVSDAWSGPETLNRRHYLQRNDKGNDDNAGWTSSTYSYLNLLGNHSDQPSTNMAEQAGCSSWSTEEEEEGEDEEEEVEEEEEGNTSNSSLMPPSSSPTPTWPTPTQPPSLLTTPPSSSATPPAWPRLIPTSSQPKAELYTDSAPCGNARDVVPWRLTPEVVMVQILAYLGDRDRCNASLVCTAWRRVFHRPCLWRRRYFLFRWQK